MAHGPAEVERPAGGVRRPAPPGTEPLFRLALVRGVGPQRYAALIRRFGDAADALGAPVAELERVPSIGPRLARQIAEIGGPTGDAAMNEANRRLDRVGAFPISPEDPRYPAAFRNLSDPPFIIFAAGDLSLLARPGVAMVGTRTPTHYGRAAVEMLSNGLVFAGYTVVSGMARGIDTLAHRAALDAGGGTVGVLGHGIDGVYPPENRALFAEMRDRGVLLTEMAPGERPLAGNFPRRNRLIAALSRAVLVVEMGLKSGAQHTVTYALELGREVMAVPGPIDSRVSAGTNQLIKDGARVVTTVEDVLEELGGVGATAPGKKRRHDRDEQLRRPAGREPALELLSAEEGRVLAALGPDPRHADLVGAEAEVGAGRVLGVLLGLELKGAVVSLPGQLYRRR